MGGFCDSRGIALAMRATGDARCPGGVGVEGERLTTKETPEAMITTMTSADQRIHDAVMRHLAWEPSLDASIVVVATRDGVVTLSGYVETCAEKTVAERIASEVFGVRAIVNDLEVRVALHRIDPRVRRETAEALKSHGDGRPALSVAVEYLRDVRGALNRITAS
jgi:hypothetical protein